MGPFPWDSRAALTRDTIAAKAGVEAEVPLKAKFSCPTTAS